MAQYAQQYLRSAEAICSLYDGRLPLAAFLKQYFKQHKKFGSKDRRHIAHVCYCFFRLGHALRELPFDQRARVALFLCERLPGSWASIYDEDWIAGWHPALPHRLSFIALRYPAFSALAIFPFLNRTGDAFGDVAFSVSHLVQPDLFIRIRPGKLSAVTQKLAAAGIPYNACGNDCLALPNGSRVDEVLTIDVDGVIQDLSSQRVAGVFDAMKKDVIETVWDCCAASGGKSLLAWDAMGAGIRLTVSDLRPSIIRNLQKRFATAGLVPDHIFVADLSVPFPSKKQFDLVICDAPCTGSGTWGRTPEQLYFFDEKRIGEYASLQGKIVKHILPSIKKKGYLLYITCSVFKDENEAQVAHLTKAGLEVVQTVWLKGFPEKADSMFACLLRKPS